MPQDNAALWLAEEWARQFTRSVESMTGESALITFASRELTPEELDPAREELLWWEQPLNLSPDARIWITGDSGIQAVAALDLLPHKSRRVW